MPNVLLTTLREFALLTLEVLPLFLLGAVAGAAVQAFVSERWSARVFGGAGMRPLLSAVAAGALLPGCACTTVPIAAGLRGSGAPRLGTVAAFIVVSPLLSPPTVALTWAMLGWDLTAARIVASILGAIAFGLLIMRFERWFRRGLPRDAEPVPAAAVACGCGTDGCCADVPDRPGFWPALKAILRSVTPYFLVGMAIAAAIAVFVPEGAIPQALGGSAGIGAYAVAAVVGIPLYVCEGEEVPITFALLSAGLGAGPALTFLLGSVGTCIPTILMSRSVIGRRAVAFYVAFWIIFAVGSGVLLEALV